LEVASPAQRAHDRASDGRSRAPSACYESWREYLGKAPRTLAIGTASASGFVVSGVQAHGERPHRQILYDYRIQQTADGEGVSLARVIFDAASPVSVDDDHYAALHLHPRAGYQVCVFGTAGCHRHIGALPSCGKIVYHPTIGGVAALQPIASTNPFQDAQIDGINASMARRRIRGWRLALLSFRSGEVTYLQVGSQGEPDVSFTGELWQPAGGLIPLGLSRDYPDGRRQLGVALVGARDGACHFWWDDTYDLHTAVPDEHGREWALRASTRWHDERTPLRHELWCRNLADGRGQHRVLDDGRQQWRCPLAWPHGMLLATHQRDGLRRLEVCHDRRWRTAFEPGCAAGSVSSAAVAGPRLVTIESTVTSPPVIVVRPFPPMASAVGLAAPARRVSIVTKPPVQARVTRRIHQAAAGGMPHRTSFVVVMPGGQQPRGVAAFFHGGPTMAWSDWSWRWNPLPFAAAGYAVILVDPAGSDGYGEKARAVAWRGWRSGVVPSALEVLNKARAQHGLAHIPLATMGGSFGGYLAVAVAACIDTVLAAAHATPFEPATISLSSDAHWSWTREWGPLAGGAAALAPENLRVEDLSPRTRLLLSHGILDDQVPFQQSVKAARALRLNGGRCELALLAGVGHAIQQPALIDQWTRWVLAALDHEIGGSSHG
jgi:dienelactone hydrolase